MKNKINLMLIVGILSAVISASLYFYLYTKLMENKKDSELLHNRSVENSKALNDLEKIEKNLNMTLSQSDRLNMLFVKPDAVVLFIQKIEDIFKQLNVSGEVTSVSEEKLKVSESNDQGRVLANLSAEGDWNDLLKLVGLLERLPYKSTMGEVVLISNKSDKAIINPKDVVLVKDWSLKVKMYVWLTPIKSGDSTEQNFNLN